MYLKRTGYILLIIMIISGIFYLYLPQHSGEIQTMNATVGRERVDVVCVGSSHVYNGINPVQMYDETGIAAYDIAIGAQAPWHSYYYIREAERCQHPEIVLLDMTTFARYNISDMDDHITVRNMLDFPFSLDKLRGILASPADSPVSIMLVFPYTYDDYANAGRFTVNKYRSDPDYYMGYKINTDIEPYDPKTVVDARAVTESLQINAKCEQYLRRIIEYCRDNDIELVLVNTPCPGFDEERYGYLNYIQQIADEYGITFLNGSLHEEEMGMDYTQDSYGDGGHLNLNGVTKYTHWISEYLTEHYELPDRRGEAGYEMYEHNR